VEDSVRQNLLMNFTAALRSSALVGVVDFQRAALAFGTVVEGSEGGVVELGPLYAFMVQQGAPELAVAEVILFMKSREERFGVTFNLPSALGSMTPEQMDSVVQSYLARSSPRPTQAAPLPLPEIPKQTTSTLVGQTKFGGSSGYGARKTTRLSIALAVAAAAAVANFMFSALTRSPPPVPLNLTDPAGLPCMEPVGSNGAVVCFVPTAFFAKESKEGFDARAQVTKAAVTVRGFRRILVLTKEDSKLRRAIVW
jgi:hypothetical protein